MRKKNEEYGYVRVSSKDQNEQRQIVAMRKLKIKNKNIFIDKLSGKDFNRDSYKRLLQVLKPGDVLYIKSINRLGRNYLEITENWRLLNKEKQVDIVVMDMPLLDTRYAKNLIGTFLADVVLQILSFVAENERENIKVSQAEGIAVAKANGVQFGRPRCMDQDGFNAKYSDLKDAGHSNREIREKLQLSNSTFYRYLKKMDSE